MSELSSKQCVPCRGGVPALRGEDITKLQDQLADWKVVNEHHLQKSYRFKDFREAQAFVNRVGNLAEEQGHNFTERADTDPAVNPLTPLELARYDLLVLGSNNRRFSASEQQTVVRYVSAGGALLALSDSRFGLSPNRPLNALGAGELSDNDLLAPFGMAIEHDNYQVVVADGSRFASPTHPILRGLTSFKGEGVSLIHVTGAPARILVRGDGLLLTDGHTITGPDYAITAVAQVGRGPFASLSRRKRGASMASCSVMS